MLLIDSGAALSRCACWSAASTRSTAVDAVSFDLFMASEISRTDAFSSSAPAATWSIMPLTFFALQTRDHLCRGVGCVFDDLERLAVEIEDRVVGGLDPDTPAALGDPLVFRGLLRAAIEGGPEVAIFGAVALGGIDKHAVVVALDLSQSISDRVQEIVVRGDDGAIHVELDDRLRFTDRSDLAGDLGVAHFLFRDVG